MNCDDSFMSVRSLLARKSNPDDEPWFISQNHSSWADFPQPRYDCFSLSLFWACSRCTDWPVICESPMVSLINHERRCHASRSLSAWDLNGKSSISMDDRLDLCGSWPKEELGDNGWAHSFNPGTENTSVARGSLFHQRSVWQHLRQMLRC